MLAHCIRACKSPTRVIWGPKTRIDYAAQNELKIINVVIIKYSGR